MAYLTACTLCDGRRIRPLYRLRRIGVTVFECGDCSLRFVGNDLSEEYLAELYNRQGLADYFVALGERHERKFAPRLREMARLVGGSGLRVLDVGCGIGEFPALAVRAGYDCVGLDVSKPSIETARRLHPGVAFRLGSIEELAAAEPQSFDVVTLWDVIEHVRDAHSMIAGCAEVLRPGGTVAIGTPNGDSSYDRVAHLTYGVLPSLGALLLVQRYSEWHLQIWTIRTIRRLLEDHGFQIVFAARQRELTATPSLYVAQVGLKRLAAAARSLDKVVEAGWPIRNKLTVYARTPS